MASTMHWRAAVSVMVILVVACRRPQLVQQLLDPILAGDRGVVDELQIGRPPQPQPRSELAPQERPGALERLGGRRTCLLVAERGVVDARQLQVRADLHAG